jgi:IPT/TIG domain
VEFCASVPVLDSISPASVQAGGPDFSLTLKGRHFHFDSSVLWNGLYLFGKTINENEIHVTVPAANTLHEGSAQAWVVNDPGGTNLNGPCGGGPSAKLTFAITP